jgi:fused signal recognition particle receptor
LFESLKKKFTGTIGKISDKLSEEEEAEKAEEESKVSEETSVEEVAVPKEEKIVSGDEKELLSESEEKKASPEEPSKTGEPSKKSGFMGFLRRSKPETETEMVSGEKVSSGETLEETLKEPSEIKEPSEKSSEELSEEKSGPLSFIRQKTISEKDIDDVMFELELSLLEGDVAMEVAEKIINSVKEDLVGRKIKRRSDVAEFTREALKKAISNILDVEGRDIKEMVENREKGEPVKLMFVGINGTGKTTTIAKIATYFMKEGYKSVIAASDTFRAGAIEQITHHADKLGVKIIKHQRGADPAAVAYDAVEHARAKDKDLVLIDTAGRMQTNVNLMDEMKKIKRVVSPDMIIYVGDALTGNDAVEQAHKFDEAVGVDGIILTKADADARGGAALSIGYVIQKPILFLGVGQAYEDIMEFKPDWMVDQIFGE